MTLLAPIEEAIRTISVAMEDALEPRVGIPTKKRKTAPKKKKKKKKKPTTKTKLSPAGCIVEKPTSKTTAKHPTKAIKKKRKPAHPAQENAKAASDATCVSAGPLASIPTTSPTTSSPPGASPSQPPSPSGPPPYNPIPPLYSGTPVFGPRASVGGDSGWLNVMSYGAHGDGVSDDTTALNAACSAARQVNVDGGAAVVYLPAGTYKVSGAINVFNVFLRGDSMAASTIYAPQDWAASGSPNSSWVLDQQPSGSGVGNPAQDVGDTGSAPAAGTWIEDIGLQGPAQVNPGQVPCKLSGIRVGAGAGFRRVKVNGFFAGAFLFSSEERLLGPSFLGNNYYGIYYGGPSPSVGDQVIADMDIDNCAWSGIGVSSTGVLQGAAFRAVSLRSSPFGIYKEEAPALGGQVLVNCVLSSVLFDSCGNGNIFVNGPSGAGADIASCIFQATQSTNVFASATSLSLSTPDVQGRAIGRSAAPFDLLGGNWAANEVQATDPAYLGPGQTYTCVIACGAFSGGRYGPAAGPISQVVEDGKRFTNGSCCGDALLQNAGTTCRLLPAVGSAIAPGDLVESATSTHGGAQQSTGQRRVLGVAMHAADNGDSLPVAHSGLVTLNSGSNSISVNDPLAPDPSQGGCVATTVLTDPAVIAVAQGPSSSGQVLAMLTSL